MIALKIVNWYDISLNEYFVVIFSNSIRIKRKHVLSNLQKCRTQFRLFCYFSHYRLYWYVKSFIYMYKIISKIDWHVFQIVWDGYSEYLEARKQYLIQCVSSHMFIPFFFLNLFQHKYKLLSHFLYKLHLYFSCTR
jgi:hypothetical protein